MNFFFFVLWHEKIHRIIFIFPQIHTHTHTHTHTIISIMKIAYVLHEVHSWHTKGLFGLLLTQYSVLISHHSNSVSISYIFVSPFSITLSNFCLVLNLGCMSQCLSHNFDKVVEPTHCEDQNSNTVQIRNGNIESLSPSIFGLSFL